jgi:YesN/AraC family two-component response regulator
MTMGINGDIAESGKEALHLMENNKYDIVITDIGMPEMNGWQLADEINRLYHKIKVVILSGWGAQVSKKEREKHNVCEVLSKPIDFAKISAILNSIYNE